MRLDKEAVLPSFVMALWTIWGTTSGPIGFGVNHNVNRSGRSNLSRLIGHDLRRAMSPAPPRSIRWSVLQVLQRIVFASLTSYFHPLVRLAPLSSVKRQSLRTTVASRSMCFRKSSRGYCVDLLSRSFWTRQLFISAT